MSAGRTGSVVSAGKDGIVVLWDAKSANPRMVFSSDPIVPMAKGGPLGAPDAALSPDGTLVASVHADGPARIWDAATGRVVHRLATGPGGGLTLAFHPDGTRLATVGFDRKVRVWDVGTGAELVALPHPAEVRTVQFSRDGRTMITTCQNGVIAIRRTSDWSTEAALRDGPGLTSATLSPDSALIAVGHADGTIALWRATDGSRVTSSRAHSGPVNTVAISPDGRTLATAGLDQTIRLWSMDPLRLSATLTGSTSGIADLAWSPDGRFLYSADGDHTVTSWVIRPGDAAERICHDLARDFPGHPRPDCA